MNRSINDQLQEQTGVDIRNPSTSVFGISSIDRYATLAIRNDAVSWTNPYTAAISSRQNFLAGYFTRIALTEVLVQWVTPTLTENNRRIIIRYQVGGGTNPIVPYTLVLAEDWYTPTTLAAALQTAVRTATGNAGFTVTANATTGVFLARTNNTDEFQFRPYISNTEPNRIGLYEMMNWTTGSLNDTFPEWGTGIPTMLRTKFLDIVCSQLTANQSVKDSDTGIIARDVLCRVYLNDGLTQDPELLGSQPFTLHRQYSFPKQIKWLPNSPVGGYLKFEIYDDQGYIVETGSGPFLDSFRCGDWNLTLQLSEV